MPKGLLMPIVCLCLHEALPGADVTSRAPLARTCRLHAGRNGTQTVPASTKVTTRIPRLAPRILKRAS